MRCLSLFALLLLVTSCQKDYSSNPLPNILDSDHPAIKTVMTNFEAHELQIKVSEIIKWHNGNFESVDFEFQVDDSNYFYPASTVKFPIAVLALEKVNSIQDINSGTPFLVSGDSVFTSVRNNVAAIFAVSDNDAYNRLYEFLGRDYINQKLKEKELQPANIVHRLESQGAQNPETKSITFRTSDSLHYVQAPIQDSDIKPLQLNKLQKGKGYYKNERLVNSPMDFSKKNYLPISTLHELMKRVQFPQSFPPEKRFHINESDLKFLHDVMQSVPRKMGYNEDDYYDGYVKFFMFGDTEKRIPDDIRISNKVGYAYGYLTDCAYIEDYEHGISFIVTATIHVNKDDIFNDDVYEYESVGIPFLAEVGRQLHQFYVEKELYLDEHGD